MTIKTNTFYKTFCFIKSLKSRKKKLTLTLFYHVSREVLLGNSKKLICIDPSRFYIFLQPRSKMFNIISIWFSFSSDKPPVSWVAHTTRDFLTCYSCSYYSFMIISNIDLAPLSLSFWGAFRTFSRAVLVHDTRSNDSRSNDARFMHKLYIN